jgi:hypothetical protein
VSTEQRYASSPGLEAVLFDIFTTTVAAVLESTSKSLAPSLPDQMPAMATNSEGGGSERGNLPQRKAQRNDGLRKIAACKRPTSQASCTRDR